MKREAILQTAVCYKEGDDFIVESPLFDVVMGVGETEKEAFAIFKNLLDEAYIEYLEGNVVGYEKPGRPKKGGVNLHTLVRPETKALLVKLTTEWEISLGECVDFFTFLFAKNPPAKIGQAKVKCNHPGLRTKTGYENRTGIALRNRDAASGLFVQELAGKRKKSVAAPKTATAKNKPAVKKNVRTGGSKTPKSGYKRVSA